jgi:CHAT domain-containing protein
VDYSQFNKVYSLSIESEIVKNDDYLSGISDSICKSLGEDEVFIQWIYVPYRFDFKNFTSIESPFYIQLSYFKNGTINYHILENGEGIHEAINYWKNQIINQNDIDEKIISQITTPFLKEIVGYKKIILCPSGRLIEIPFESISISGDFILNTHKTLVVNSAKSYLDNFKHDNFAQKPEGNFVFVGSESYKTSTSSSFSNLPGVKKEKDLLETICTKSEIKSEFYFNDGLEESHLKNIEKPYILHIAAHGILFSDSSIVKNQNLLRQTESVSTEDFYSGIVFSNASSHTPLVKNDQVLNEQEFSLLDLRKTHLVTLSSCFSGNGQETLGDGVMGFRKAIAETGAKYTLVSNWSIDDQITVEFMSQFYKCILELKMDVETAYRSTQLELKSKYKYPVYWASFTLIKN